MTDNERAVSLASDGLANVLALSWMNEHRAEVHAEKERDGGATLVILRESFRRRMTEESVTWEYGFFACAAPSLCSGLRLTQLGMTENLRDPAPSTALAGAGSAGAVQ